MKALLAALALAAGPAAAAPPKIEAELRRAVDRIYDLDYEAAERAFDALAARHPGHPAGPFYRGVADYQRWVAEGMSAAGTYDSFERRMDEAAAAAERLLATEPAAGHYYAGAVRGFRARALASRRRYVSAVPQAMASVRHLKKALELDPSLEDARLGLGMYHYFGARMPAGARPFAFLLSGETPDRELGLAELERVANSSGTARWEARGALAMIYSRDVEAQYEKADALLAELVERYPRNPVYRLRRAFAAMRRKDYDRSVALADPDGKWADGLTPALRVRAKAGAWYRAVEARALQGRIEDAEKWLILLEGSEPPKGMRDWILIRRGNLEDARGRRAAADAAYDAVKDSRARAVAKAFKHARYPAGPKDTMPFFAGY